MAVSQVNCGRGQAVSQFATTFLGLLRPSHILNVVAVKIAVPETSRAEITFWYVRLTLWACVVGVLVGIIRVLLTLSY